MLYEFDLRKQRHNLLATLDRRQEAYHDQVLVGPGEARSIVDPSQLAAFKHEGLAEKIQYDENRRKSCIDHFFDVDASAADIASGKAVERGDFATGSYEASIRRNPDRMQVLLSRKGNVWGIPLTLSKAITLSTGSDTVELGYRLEDLPDNFCQHLAIEFNFAGLPSRTTGRCFRIKMAWILDILELILISRKHLISASRMTGLTFRPPSTAVWQVMVDMPECGHFQSSRSVNQRVALNSFISRQSSCLTGLSHLMQVGAGKSLLTCRLLVLLKPPNHLIRQKKLVRVSKYLLWLSL